MNRPEEIIVELESSNSRLFKENIILREMKHKNKDFLLGLTYACDKLKTFGIKKVPISKKNGEGLSWKEFEIFLTQLIDRKITGNLARDKILEMMDLSNMNQWNYFYRRILIKDLRCGLSEKTVNNVAKKNEFLEFLIPVFNCQLAQDSELHTKKLIGKKFLERKLDGVRVITILYANGKVDMFSRNGKELNNFDHIKDEFRSATKINKIENSVVIDGEIVSKNFQELMKQIYRKDNTQNSDAILYTFDYLPLFDFKKGICSTTQNIRIKQLDNWITKNQNNLKHVKFLDRILVDLDTVSGEKTLENFNTDAVKMGYEGIMIKDYNGIYECKRSTSWLKSKPVIEVSLKVKAVEEGTGRNIGRLGAVNVEGIDGGKAFKLSVGSGFSDSQRLEFWKKKDELLNQIIEIKADAITKSQDSKYWSLRFPRFKNFRGFKEDEKI